MHMSLHVCFRGFPSGPSSGLRGLGQAEVSGYRLISGVEGLDRLYGTKGFEEGHV